MGQAMCSRCSGQVGTGMCHSALCGFPADPTGSPTPSHCLDLSFLISKTGMVKSVLYEGPSNTESL